MLASLLFTAADADTAAPAPILGQCQLWFSGSSTLHGFKGTAACEPFTLEATDTGASGSALWKTHVRVAVASMTTDNRGRDRNMAKMFDAQTYPWIQASFDAIEAGPIDTLEFELTIGKSTHAVIAKISDWNASDDEASFSADFSLSLAEYGLKPPSVFGIIRVADKVEVSVAATVKRQH